MRQKISKGKQEMNNKINQQHLTKIYCTLAQYTYFSNVHQYRLYSEHKTNLNTLKKKQQENS